MAHILSSDLHIVECAPKCLLRTREQALHFQDLNTVISLCEKSGTYICIHAHVCIYMHVRVSVREAHTEHLAPRRGGGGGGGGGGYVTLACLQNLRALMNHTDKHYTV